MFKRTAQEWTLEGIAVPHGVSLLSHIEHLLPEGGRGPLPNGGEPLPDARPAAANEIKWSAGSMDGVMSHHFGGPGTGNEPVAAAAAVVDLLRKKPDQRRFDRAVERIEAVGGPQQIDRFIESLVESRDLSRGNLATFARWLCEHGTRRENVKAGIALLGISGTADDAQLIARLGLAEELTLFAVVGLTNLLPEPESAIFDLAQQVEGWGRVQAVQRLEGSTTPEIRDWLLRGGAENSVMTEYLALLAAQTGGLREALEAGADGDLLGHGGELLRALANGGPVEAMEGYADAAPAMLAYLHQVQDAKPTLDLLDNLIALDHYARERAAEHPQITAEQRTEIVHWIDSAMTRPQWQKTIREGLQSDDPSTLWRSMTSAERYGVDAEPTVRARLSESPFEQFMWQWLLMRADEEQLRGLIDEMEHTLPLDSMNTGPADDYGLGAGYEAESCLGQGLQRMAQVNLPGVGWALVRTGLNNRVMRNRNTALRVLQQWPRESWPVEAIEILRGLQFREPNEKTRTTIRQLLNDSSPAAD
jgi:hypothetical protein